MGYYKKKRRSTKRKERLVTYSLIPTVGMAGILLTSYLSSTPLTIAGIPPSIIFSAVQDKGVISAFVTGDSGALHDELKQMGVEEKMNDFYRNKIPDQQERDRYIHQRFYDHSGYVGTNYKTTPSGNLRRNEES
jgi:hypothetical protein